MTERMWLAVMVLPTTNCLAMSATCSVAAVLATSSACNAAQTSAIPTANNSNEWCSGELEAYKGGIEASVKKANDLVVSVRHGHCGFLAPYEKESV